MTRTEMSGEVVRLIICNRSNFTLAMFALAVGCWKHFQVKEDLPGADKCYRAALEADPEDKDAARRLAKVVFLC